MIKVGLVRGTFRLIHPGHVKLLEQAKSLVDTLHVAIDSDDLIKKAGRVEILSQGDRAKVLMGFKSVDFVHVFSSEEEFDSICASIQHNIVNRYYYFKGGDYKPMDLPEYKKMTNAGWTVCCLGHSGHSTTDIIRKIKENG